MGINNKDDANVESVKTEDQNTVQVDNDGDQETIRKEEADKIYKRYVELEKAEVERKEKQKRLKKIGLYALGIGGTVVGIATGAFLWKKFHKKDDEMNAAIESGLDDAEKQLKLEDNSGLDPVKFDTINDPIIVAEPTSKKGK